MYRSQLRAFLSYHNLAIVVMTGQVALCLFENGILYALFAAILFSFQFICLSMLALSREEIKNCFARIAIAYYRSKDLLLVGIAE